MNFNAATFLDSTNMTARQVQRLGHEDDVAPWSNPVRTAQRAPVDAELAQRVQALEQAAARFAVRRDSFAAGKAATCLDLAAKLERFGSFVSDKQDDFARKLVEWSLPRQAAVQAPAVPVAAPVAAPAPVTLPKLHALMQRLAKLTIDRLQIARKNQDQLCWVKVVGVDGVVGRIDNGVLTIFTARLSLSVHGMTPADILAALQAIEVDPEAAAVLHGKASGRCAICSRDLTDPASIERGVGPICIEKAGW